MADDQEEEYSFFAYLKDDWHLWLSNAEDREVFEDTWDEWWEHLQGNLRAMRAVGIEPNLIRVPYAEFDEHCRATGVANNAAERSRYAARAARRQASSRDIARG